ncbi:MAG: Maf family protein [Pseudomonadota bacterium]
MAKIILASGSAIRAQMLKDAGVVFDVIKTGVDEAAIKRQSVEEGETADLIALRLAVAKARAAPAPAEEAAGDDGLAGAYVIGCDQILEMDGEIYDKPQNLSEARSRLVAMQGRSHALVNGLAVIRDGEVVFTNSASAILTMRAFDEAAIEAYLSNAGEGILSSVGGYQVEKLGSRLFSHIDGDYFTVLGMALLPLLGFLRDEKAIAY